jgi:hypothetical protein
VSSVSSCSLLLSVDCGFLNHCRSIWQDNIRSIVIKFLTIIP